MIAVVAGIGAPVNPDLIGFCVQVQVGQAVVLRDFLQQLRLLFCVAFRRRG